MYRINDRSRMNDHSSLIAHSPASLFKSRRHILPVLAGVLSLSACNSLRAEPQVLRFQGGQPELQVHWQASSKIAAAQPVAAQPVKAQPALKLRLAQDINPLPKEPGAPAAAPKNDPADRKALEVPITPDEGKPPAPAPVTRGEGEEKPAAPPVEAPPATLPGETPVTPPDVAGPTLRPSAVEGRQIADVRVSGNRVISNESILLQVQGTRAGFAFSPLQAERDRARIENMGFFAAVDYQVLPNLEDTNKIDVVFVVVENRVVTGFEFKGNTIIPQAELEAALKVKPGAVLNNKDVNADVETIQKLFRQRGYAVLVTDVRQNERGVVVFTLSFATISQIKIEGNKKTDESLIRKQIRTEPGTTFNELELRKDLNRIFDMGFFEDINFKVDPDPAHPGALIVTIVVQERRTGQLSVGVGFDNRSKISGFLSVSENNLGGSGQRVGASIELGSQRSYSLSYGNPFVGKKNASYDVSVYDRSFYREPRRVQLLTGLDVTGGTFEEQRQGGQINFSQPLDQNRYRTILYGYRNEKVRLFQTDITTGEPIGPTLLDSAGRTSAFSLGFVRDRRDLRLDPSRGGREQLVVEQGLAFLGGTNSFTKFDLDVRRYIPLIKGEKLGDRAKLVLAGRLVAGQSVGQLPAFEQYFIGGSDTVRGYDTDEQFGDNQIYSNLELRYRLKPQFQLVAFADAGSAYGGNIALNSSPNFLFSVGAGLRLQTPIGPVRLDIGFGKDGAKTHFAIGPTF
jgi:outer membrane protein insertion porin family